jgi:hypothetical protein
VPARNYVKEVGEERRWMRRWVDHQSLLNYYIDATDGYQDGTHLVEERKNENYDRFSGILG